MSSTNYKSTGSPHSNKTPNFVHKVTHTYKLEWPTLLLFFAVYTLWLGTTLLHEHLPWYLTLIPLIYIVALHSSLQHEVIHGHPTAFTHLNKTLAFPALGLLVPYERYEILHLQHHRNWLLTDPYDDSESYFLAAKQWARLSNPVRQLFLFNNTLVGRLSIGPAIMFTKMIASEWQLAKHNTDIRISWLFHFIAVALAITWLLYVDFSLWYYLAFVAYPATSLLMLRAYSEHLPEEAIENRSAIIKSNAAMRLLYLNNNFHRVHHNHPELAWYQLPRKYHEHYADQTTHVYSGYWQLFKQFGFTPRYSVEHPFLARD